MRQVETMWRHDRLPMKIERFEVPRDHYEILNDTLASLDAESIDIPPTEEKALYGLTFISTRVPHAGHTSRAGHFLISYGAYIAPELIGSFFEKEL